MIWESEFQESERNFDALRRRNLSTASRVLILPRNDGYRFRGRFGFKFGRCLDEKAMNGIIATRGQL
jgi:hypothetical protein